MLSNVEALEQKYSLLKDQISKITKIIEDEKYTKEKTKSKKDEDIKNMENRIKHIFNEEREVQ